jgi:hypothetical protein
VTSHKAQGRTCDEVIVCAARLDAKATYVAFSRARQQANGYTPDKAALFAALPAMNRPRQAVLDVWTPTRSDRLRWVRSVVERVRELLTPFVPLPATAAPVPAVVLPIKPRHAIGESTSSERSHHSVHHAPAMRMRL